VVVESVVVSAREEEPVQEVGGKRFPKTPRKAYTTCSVYVEEKKEGVLAFAVCRPGPPGAAKWVKRRPLLVIPHADFITCDASLYRSKYKLGGTISALLAETCRSVKAKYGAKLM